MRCLQNHPYLSSRLSYISFRYAVRYRRNVFVLWEIYCYSFTSEKTYLEIQAWRLIKWFRYPCYVADCYPWWLWDADWKFCHKGNCSASRGLPSEASRCRTVIPSDFSFRTEQPFCRALFPMTFEIFISDRLDLYRDCVTRISDNNSHDFKRNMTNSFLWDFHWSTVKFTKSGFSIKVSLLFKLHIRWSGTFVNLKEQFDNMSYRLSLLRSQSYSNTPKVHDCLKFDFDPLRVELRHYGSFFDETN